MHVFAIHTYAATVYGGKFILPPGSLRIVTIVGLAIPSTAL